VRPSMGSVGDCFDNAMAESFFASLECEVLDRNSFQTRDKARSAIFAWIEGGTILTAGILRSGTFHRRSSRGASSRNHARAFCIRGRPHCCAARWGID